MAVWEPTADNRESYRKWMTDKGIYMVPKFSVFNCFPVSSLQPKMIKKDVRWVFNSHKVAQQTGRV